MNRPSDHAVEFRRCLTDLDVAQARRLWAHVNPHLPQPRSDGETLIMLHHARTQAKSVAFKLRAYSHAWLVERSLPSGLPDELRPPAERIYPRVVEAVGIAVVAGSPERTEHARAVRSAMENAVLESYADGVRDPAIIKARMGEARRLSIRS